MSLHHIFEKILAPYTPLATRRRPVPYEDAEDTEEMEEGYCAACSGSGEGMHERTTCRVCKGSGSQWYPVKRPIEDEADE